MKKKAVISALFLLVFFFLFPITSTHAVSLNLDNGGYNFGPGSTFKLSIGLSHSGSPVGVDLYLLILAPDNAPFFLTFDELNNLIVIAANSDPSTWRPLLSGISIPDGLNTGSIDMLSFIFEAGFMAGTYQTIFACSYAGTLDFISAQAKTFLVSSLQVANGIGNFNGNWVNNTYNTSGPVTFTINDTSAGVLSMTITLGGTVYGVSAPPAFTLTGNIDPQGLITLSGGTTSFGTLQGTIGANGNISATVSSIPSYLGINSMNLSGTLANNILNLNYTVYFSSGSQASGSVTATRQ